MNGTLGFQLRYGTFDQFAFAYFIENLIDNLTKDANLLNKKLLFVLDNVEFHASYMMKNLLLAKDLDVLFIPPYHPMADPVEFLFFYLKTHLRNVFIKNRLTNFIINSTQISHMIGLIMKI